MSAAKRRRRTRRRSTPGPDRARLFAWLGLALFVVLGIIGTIAFDDRHWHAFDNAGDAAFERGNYRYAERMYNEALQVALDRKDDELIARSRQALRQVQAAQQGR